MGKRLGVLGAAIALVALAVGVMSPAWDTGPGVPRPPLTAAP